MIFTSLPTSAAVRTNVRCSLIALLYAASPTTAQVGSVISLATVNSLATPTVTRSGPVIGIGSPTAAASRPPAAALVVVDTAPPPVNASVASARWM